MKNMATFDVKTLRAKGGMERRPYKLDGDYFGLPWPCYGHARDQASGLAQPLRQLAST